MRISLTKLFAICVVLFCAVHDSLAASQRSSIKKALEGRLENATKSGEAVEYQIDLPENIDNNLFLNDGDEDNYYYDDDYDDDDNDSTEILYNNENYLMNGEDAIYGDETGIGARTAFLGPELGIENNRYENNRVRPTRRRRKNRKNNKNRRNRGNRRIRKIRIIRKKPENRRVRRVRIVRRPIN